jgi:hypothetical protein
VENIEAMPKSLSARENLPVMERPAVLVRCGTQRGIRRMRRKSEDYRRYAEECLRLGQTTDNPQTRAILLQMAQVWLRLAEQAENGSDGPPAAD